MRSVVTSLLGVFVTISLGLTGSLLGGAAVAAQRAEPELPQSLDNLYPPAAGQPVYLLHMLSLDEHFTGIMVDVLENDLAGARENYEGFRTRYAEVRNLVPEWEAYYPTGPVEEVGAAFASDDPNRLMATLGEVGNICHQCHVATMVPVQQRYHWGDFGALTVKDPLSHESVAFSRFKQYLSANLTGVRVNLRQGQAENARRQFEAFQTRFETLKESCLNCHDREGLSFVDGKVTAAVQQLGHALEDPQPPAETVATLMQTIGRESCSKCHLVHVPAAMARTSSR